jgi:hypothetical protein
LACFSCCLACTLKSACVRLGTCVIIKWNCTGSAHWCLHTCIQRCVYRSLPA